MQSVARTLVSTKVHKKIEIGAFFSVKKLPCGGALWHVAESHMADDDDDYDDDDFQSTFFLPFPLLLLPLLLSPV